MENIIQVKGNQLKLNGKTYTCAIGKNGFSKNKSEGDLATPIGEYPLREVLFRADKLSKPETKLPISIIQQNQGWCDAPADPNYNKKITLPYAASHEKLWRDDNLYDVVITLGYNDAPPIPGKGSAIFMHVAKPQYEGTEGCIALKIDDLREVLKQANPQTVIRIEP